MYDIRDLLLLSNCNLEPIDQSSLSLLSPVSGNHHSVLNLYSLIFSDFYLWLRRCDICSVPDLFHLKQCPPVQFILSQALRFLSYIWIFSFLYMYHISLFFCKLMDGGYFSVLVLKTVVHESVSLTCWFIPASGWNVCKYLSHLFVQRCVCWFSVWATWPLLKWSVNVSKNYKLKTIFPLGLLEFAFYIWSWNGAYTFRLAICFHWAGPF